MRYRVLHVGGAWLRAVAVGVMLGWCGTAAAQPPAAPAQGTMPNMPDHRGGIRGTVRNDAGAPVVDATVTAVNAENGAQFTATTDAQGAYAFGALPVGTYDVSIVSAGLTAFRRRASRSWLDGTAAARHRAERDARPRRPRIRAPGAAAAHRHARAAHQRSRIDARCCPSRKRASGASRSTSTRTATSTTSRCRARSQTVTYQRERVYRRQTISEKIEEALADAEEQSVERRRRRRDRARSSPGARKGDASLPNKQRVRAGVGRPVLHGRLAQYTIFFADIVGAERRAAGRARFRR